MKVSTILLFLTSLRNAVSFTVMMSSDRNASSRRTFFQNAASGCVGLIGATFGVSLPARAAPEVFNTPSGIKYAVLQQPKKAGSSPRGGDIVAIEYTGYLTDGKIFDSTHSEGKSNALLFKLGSDVVIEGINEMVSNMEVGQKVQCIIPPKLAFGDKGLCIEDGECLIKPGSTLVYDIFLKKSSIPPP